MSKPKTFQLHVASYDLFRVSANKLIEETRPRIHSRRSPATLESKVALCDVAMWFWIGSISYSTEN